MASSAPTDGSGAGVRTSGSGSGSQTPTPTLPRPTPSRPSTPRISISTRPSTPTTPILRIDPSSPVSPTAPVNTGLGASLNDEQDPLAFPSQLSQSQSHNSSLPPSRSSSRLQFSPTPISVPTPLHNPSYQDQRRLSSPPRGGSPSGRGSRTHSPARSPLAHNTNTVPASMPVVPLLSPIESVGTVATSGTGTGTGSGSTPFTDGRRGRRRKRGTFSIGADDDDKVPLSSDSPLSSNGNGLNEKSEETEGESSRGRTQRKVPGPSPHVAFEKRGSTGSAASGFNFDGPHRGSVSKASAASGSGSGSGEEETKEGREKDKEGAGTAGAKEGSEARKPGPLKKVFDRVVHAVLNDRHVTWIPPKWTWADIKPVIRISVSIWIGFILVLIKESGQFLGSAAFFGLIVSCMTPPSQPFVQVLEVVLNTVFYTACAWAWCCMTIAIANATRVPTDPQKVADAVAQLPAGLSPAARELRLVSQGVFLQAAPAAICCVFLSVGCGILLWWKMRTVPSPATFPIVLSCILIDITLTTAQLYNRPFYMSAFTIWKPIAIQSGIGLLCSAVIFPESVTSQFRRRFGGVLGPLESGMKEIETLFTEACSMSKFATEDATHHRVTFADPAEEHEAKIKEWGDRSDQIRKTLMNSLAGMQPLQSQMRYLPIDLSYGRLSGEDLWGLFDILASMQVRASGMSFFFNAVVNKVRHTHLDSQGFSAHETVTQTLSRPGSRPGSRPNSRPPSRQASARDLTARQSMDNMVHDSDDDHHTPGTAPGSRRGSQADDHNGHEHDHEHSFAHHLRLALKSHSKSGLHLHSSHHSSHHSPKGSGSGLHLHKHSLSGLHSHRGSHISLLESLRKVQQPVGVYESQRYMDLERGDERDLRRLVSQLELLSMGALPLVKCLGVALKDALTWSKTSDKKRHEFLRTVQKTHGMLVVALDEFKEHRTEVTRPYRHLFDPSHPASDNEHMRHAGLFYCFVAQYHLIEFSDAVVKFLAKVIEIDTKRQKRRLWYPTNWLALFGEFGESVKPHTADGTETETQQEMDDDRETHESDDEYDEETGLLGEARRRNPDYHPFNSPIMNLLSKLSKIPDLLSSRSAMFALKAGAISALTTLPAFMSSSAHFYYENRGMWCSIMAQMTLAVFSGDTFNSWLARFQATFWGILFGIIVWYIGAGHGTGNPYGMAVITAFAFPMAMFYRMYYPAGVLTTVVCTTSIMLVIGYSWQNANILQITAATWGWDVAWRRFVCVVIGITAAWVWSVVPPSFSIKRAIRNSYAGSIMTSGRILCQILSMAHDPHNHTSTEQYQKNRKDLLKARTKLSKMGMRHVNAVKELSMRGRWPEERYQGLLATLLETMSLLAQLNHLLPQMDAGWRRALLARTRLGDPLFLGDVLAVISMTSAALKAAAPLPQITPGPLVAKYHMNKYKGLDLPVDPAHGHDEGLPVHVTADVLESDEYMRYALGVTTVYALMARLDAIVVVCKTLLGENFHIGHLRVNDVHVNHDVA